LNIDQEVKVVHAQAKQGASHEDVRIHLLVGIDAHKREDTIHHHVEKALNDHHIVDAVHHKIEVERITRNKSIISIFGFMF